MVEQLTVNQLVAGSSPARGAIKKDHQFINGLFYSAYLLQPHSQSGPQVHTGSQVHFLPSAHPQVQLQVSFLSFSI